MYIEFKQDPLVVRPVRHAVVNPDAAILEIAMSHKNV
jgi:hypothetical protein